MPLAGPGTPVGFRAGGDVIGGSGTSVIGNLDVALGPTALVVALGPTTLTVVVLPANIVVP